ncbi:MAG: hypothetical protein ACRDQA_11155 [Nocardioidaceae bacterium]
MSRWHRGEASIERLIAGDELKPVTGTQADGQPWIARARRTLTSAAELADTDPDSAYVLAYDAARFACTALLTHQGLRPTTTGGHYAIDVAVRDQFGGPFHQFGGLRRQRNELEYPALATENLTPADAAGAVTLATQLIDTAQQLLPNLGLFTTNR